MDGFHEENLPVSNDTKRECGFENCHDEVVGHCTSCGGDFCLNHASEADPQRFCAVCLPLVDLSVKEEPLVDKDGVIHQGRHIIPQGNAYGFTTKMVHEMSDDELKAYVEYMTQRVRDMERGLEYCRISKGMGEYELYARHIGPLAKVGGEIRFGSTASAQHLKRQRTLKTVKAAKPDRVEQLAQQLRNSLSAEDLQFVVEVLKKS